LNLKSCFALLIFILPYSLTQFVAADVQLQPHQEAPVRYLLEHPSQKGLLLYHSLGSGKTFVALDYAEKNPKNKVVILLPQFLKSNWISQMRSFGVKNPARYKMISLEESDQLLKYDLTETIVIVDEVHKLVQRIRQIDRRQSEKYSNVYDKISSAYKLLLLTGTPLFSDTSDIAYIGNLLLEDQPFPVDVVKFRTEYMRIKPVTSLFRGHVAESKLMYLAFPFFITLGAVVTVGTALPWAIPLVAIGGASLLPYTNEHFPVNEVSFRKFDADQWKQFSDHFVSYYQVKLVESKDYPTREVIEKKIPYNDHQVNFFLSFIDEDLNTDQLKIMLAEDHYRYQDRYLKFHSSKLQKQLLANQSSGREIGNLDFLDENQKRIESPKFLEVYKLIQESSGQVAVYSNYDFNGIQRFAAFLDRQGMAGQYVTLTPEQTVEKQMELVAKYNEGKTRILLIHPEITEGISLIGTEQLHILEPISNAALLDQVIGRTIRYRSHSHLPENRRKVNVYLWESSIDYTDALIFPTSAALIKREHWQRKYAEVNPSMWTKGIVELDQSYFLKNETPDARSKRHNKELEKDLISFKELLENSSIEKRSRGQSK
jgi:superfamily II DNA or RNA helicase